MFKAPSHYFLSISFDWKDIFKLLNLSEEIRSNFKINEKYYYQSVNANDTDGLGINGWGALFEYYIMPNVLRNGGYSYSSIFDQQLKRFFESPNINYGAVLTNPDDVDEGVGCLFTKNITSGKAGFTIVFSKNGEGEALIFYFDEKYLNLKNAHAEWAKQIPFEVCKVSYGQNKDTIRQNLIVSPNIFWLKILVQSQEDAQMSPFALDLAKFLKST